MKPLIRTIATLLAIAALVPALFSCDRKPVLDRERASAMIRQSRAFASPGMAPRVLKSVTGVAVSGDGKTATVDFEWYFAGGPIGVAGETVFSKAFFRLYDDDWRVNESALAEAVFATRQKKGGERDAR